MDTRGCSPSAKGVPRDADAEFPLSEVTKQAGVVARTSAKQPVVWSFASSKCREFFPCFRGRLAKVGVGHVLVWRAPDSLGGCVEVANKQLLQLSRPKHEVEGSVACGLEIGVQLGEDWQVKGVEPQLLVFWRRCGFNSARDCLAELQVDRWKKPEADGPVKRCESAPESAWADGVGVVCNSVFQLCLDGACGEGCVA